MGRTPRPWFRKSRGEWYVNIDGKTHRLGADQARANAKFAALLRIKPTFEPPSESCQFATLAGAFLDWVKSNRAPMTYEWYRQYLDQFEASLEAGTLAVEVTPVSVENWVGSKTNWTDSTRHAAIRCVKACFSWAVKRDILLRSPVKIVQEPKSGSREQTLTAKQRREVIAAGGDSAWRDVVRFMLATGCRPQEIRVIEAKDWNQKTGTITVKPAGGNKRKRQIFLTAEAAAIVKRLAKRNDTGPLFRNGVGGPWDKKVLTQRFYRVGKKLNLRWLCPYSLRHTWATDALGNGVDVATVAELMGSSVMTVMRHYGHLAGKTDYLREQAKKATGS